MRGRTGVLIGCATALVLLLVPASASAYPTKKRITIVGVGFVKVAEVCTDNFKQPTPCPGAGQSVTLWADEGIKKDAVNIQPSLTFPGGGCPNAMVSGVMYTTGAKRDPDGSATRPKPGEQIEQVVWTENGSGPGGQTPAVNVVVNYQEPLIKPLRMIKTANADRGGAEIKHVAVGELFWYEIFIVNDGPSPATVHLRDRLPADFKPDPDLIRTGRDARCSIVAGILFCDGVVKPGTHTFAVAGRFTAAGRWVNAVTLKATVDGVPLPKLESEVTLDVSPAR